MSEVPAKNQPIARAYSDGDERELVALFKRVFGRVITEQHWRWKLRHPTVPVENVWIATDGDRPVFQFAGTPFQFSMSGTNVTAMVAVDAMTAPEFRRRGLLTHVASQAFRRWREQGVSFVIGLPNQQWGSRTKALGWLELFPLQWFARPLRPMDYAARRLKLPWLRHASLIGDAWNGWLRRRLRVDTAMDIEPVRNAGVEFDQLWQRLCEHTEFSTVRDAAWVRWRFLESPQRRYELNFAKRNGEARGYAAWRIVTDAEKTSAVLAELVSDPTDTARDALLADLLQRLQAARAELLITLAVPGSEYARWLRRHGFFRGPHFSLQLVPLADGLPLERMRDSSLWNLSGADFDVV